MNELGTEYGCLNFNYILQGSIEVLEKSKGEGIILSVGGGVSPGMPGDNIKAMQKALNDFNSK